MPHSRFADRLEQIEDSGWLSRMDEPIDPEDPLEEIKTETAGMDTALLGTVTGRRFPMAGPVMVDDERICFMIALESISDLGRHVGKFVDQAVAEGISIAEATLPFASDASAPLSSVLGAPVFVKQPPCQQVVRLAEDLDSTILPSLRVDQDEAVQKITASTLFTIDPDSGRQLAAGVDLVVESPTRLVPCWRPQYQLDAVCARYVELGQPMPVAILLGGDPLIRVVAEAPKPYPLDPTLVCASLWKQKVEVTPCRTIEGLTISADADLVIEGFWRGMSGDNVIDVQAVTHRINPIVPFALSGERETVRRILLLGMLPFWRAELPGLVDLTIPTWDDDGTVLVGSVEKAYANDAQPIADALADHPAWSDVRLVILLDETVNLFRESEVLAALVRHTTFGRKTLIAVGES